MSDEAVYKRDCINAGEHSFCSSCTSNPVWLPSNGSRGNECSDYDPVENVPSAGSSWNLSWEMAKNNAELLRLGDDSSTIPRWMLEKHAEIYMAGLSRSYTANTDAMKDANRWLDSVLKRCKHE